MTPKTTNYIERATSVHCGKYDYSLIKDITSNKQYIPIICPVHGIFEQAVANHICSKQGCPRCGGNFRKTTEEVMDEIDSVHGDKFKYLPFVYKNNKQKIKIICSKHGTFSQNIKEHIGGSGCPKCAKNAKMNTESFIKKARHIHGNKYDYSLTNYTKTENLVTIICPKHGSFEQTAHGHMMGYGCSKCVANSSKKENEWLDSLGIVGLKKQHRLKFGNVTRIVDGFDPATNTVYEFYGDYFHGNDAYYDHDWINRLNGKKFGELYKRTLEKEALIKEAGYKLVTMWESVFAGIVGKPFRRNLVPCNERKRNAVDYINTLKWAYPPDDDFWMEGIVDPIKIIQQTQKIV